MPVDNYPEGSHNDPNAPWLEDAGATGDMDPSDAIKVINIARSAVERLQGTVSHAQAKHPFAEGPIYDAVTDAECMLNDCQVGLRDLVEDIKKRR